MMRFLHAFLPLLVLLAAELRSQAKVRTEKVSGNVYVLYGQGGNIGLSVGDDGAFLIDDQYAPMVDQIKAAVAKLTDKAVRFVINTHWHSDHVGGNERLGKTGALIVAHANVRKRMSVEQFMKAFGRKVPASPKAALPVITYADGITMHWNGDEVRLFHVPHAHTDGDTIIVFKKANVVHMGDVFFHGMYPFIDTGSGGGLAGVIAAVDRVLRLIDDKTKVIPGHGKVTDRKGLLAYRDMLRTIHGRVKKLVAAGKSVDEVLEVRPTRDWDETHGKGFMKPLPWTRIVYESVKAETKGK